jgi:hypothetical protein
VCAQEGRSLDDIQGLVRRGFIHLIIANWKVSNASKTRPFAGGDESLTHAARCSLAAPLRCRTCVVCARLDSPRMRLCVSSAVIVEVWPLVSFSNFKFVPPHLQVLFGNMYP